MAVISARGRKHMKSPSFAIPSRRAYPINDMSHARAALSMVAKNGTPAEKRQVRRAVHRKFPSIHVSGLKK